MFRCAGCPDQKKVALIKRRWPAPGNRKLAIGKKPLFYCDVDGRSQLATIAAMDAVGELQREPVLTGLEGNFGCGLSLAKMEMGRILGYYCTGRDRVTGIDQQVVVPRTDDDSASRIELETFQTHFHLDGRLDRLPVLQVLEEDFGAGRYRG